MRGDEVESKKGGGGARRRGAFPPLREPTARERAERGPRPPSAPARLPPSPFPLVRLYAAEPLPQINM